jgi:hypothetical protein
MKTAVYQRAKSLYPSSFERCVCACQSQVIMSPNEGRSIKE